MSTTLLLSSKASRFDVQTSHVLTVEEGCLLRRTRVVIPLKHPEAVLAELYLNPPGIVRMKALDRLMSGGQPSDIEPPLKRCCS